ncbi:molybdopterin cofactor-binding domain-containing protein [Neoroseomonas soli]|uniref:molybdopterin cofactor-binding domain-containing protein n=1 Tax=Neoroseomonas soli TaxID=1081025 RepID=UPI0030BA2A5F
MQFYGTRRFIVCTDSVTAPGSKLVVGEIFRAVTRTLLLGRVANPAVIEAQATSAVTLGLSAALLEEVLYEGGVPQARNFDGYRILPQDRMPRVHVRIVEMWRADGWRRQAGPTRHARPASDMPGAARQRPFRAGSDRTRRPDPG